MTVTVSLTPPVLEKRPKMVPYGKVPGENRGEQPMEPIIYLEDPYYYVRDDTRTNKEILDHLRAENAYTKAALSHLDGRQDELYKELLSHVQETDQMVPYPHGYFVYYTRTEEGKAYHIHCRQPRHDDGAEEILLDVNKLAEGQAHCDVGSVEVSPDHKLVAYSDLTTNGVTKVVTGCDGGFEWGHDASTLFYVTQDDAHRSHKVWSHALSDTSSQSSDTCLFTEADEMFRCGIFKTRSDRFLAIATSSSVTSEVHVLDLHQPPAADGFICVAPRQEGVLYDVNHWHDSFLISTNRDDARNFKLVSVPVDVVFDKQATAEWTPVFPYDPSVKVDGVSCFDSYFALFGRQHGLTQLWICSYDTDGKTVVKKQLDMPEDMYTLGGSVNMEYNSVVHRFTYSSMTTPVQTVEYDTVTHTTTILKETPVPNYDRSLYQCERVDATASDGTIIPISLVYRKDKKKPDGQPQALHLYESAKYLTKMTTFTDFIACAEHLVATKVTSPSHMTCEGRSAGGLLMGAVLNLRPDLFTAAVAGVPFVDVMNSMCDATIPLTTGEWAEWGNPNELEYFSYMLQYSPYENVKAQAYPNLLVTGGLFDPRVAYWEPTKWVAKLRDLKTDNNQVLLKMDLDAGHFSASDRAKLRDLKTDNNQVLLKMDLDAGHFSASDRYHYLKEKAVDLSFILDQLKCLEK
ncbi:hypothetical protein DYB30_011658 [Aphanomyces astaci]|uniref:Prolyl endopeptidase n=1 Tax=Aphanomyces astaci TaxID=112090 RepID=A0A397D572_APHAT|nr:hypothetical protein DYB30_011658 [Aphanomyces astaci]